MGSKLGGTQRRRKWLLRLWCLEEEGGGLEWKGGGEWSHMPMKEISNCVCRREVVNVPLVSENELGSSRTKLLMPVSSR